MSSQRFQKLENVLDKALAKTISGVKDDAVLGCFAPEEVAVNRDLLLDLNNQIFRQTLPALVKAEVSTLYQQYQLGEKLSDLENKLKENKPSVECAVPPRDQVRAIILEQKHAERERLRQMVNQLELEATQLRGETQHLVTLRDTARVGFA